MEQIKTVAVIGLGYIGLPTAAILATHGINVIGVDVNQSTVDAVNRGEVPFVEPDLGAYLASAVMRADLSASTKTPAADAYIIAVPTPFRDNHAADLSYIDAALEAIAPQLLGGELIILESTSPPGGTQHMADHILALRPDLRYKDEGLFFAHCPERVLPGRVMIELVTNARIIGGITPRAAERAKSLYETFCQGEILVTDARTAEMTKLAENSFRDVNIAFANELSVISDKLDINVWELIRLANHHPRVNILNPGPGVGGHCIAVDPWFIVEAAPADARLIRTAREVNDSKPNWVVEKTRMAVRKLATPTIVALGMSFKADVDDTRESPALEVITRLADEIPGVKLLVVDPIVSEVPDIIVSLSNVAVVQLDEAMVEPDAVLLLVDHAAFRAGRLFASLPEEVFVLDMHGNREQRLPVVIPGEGR